MRHVDGHVLAVAATFVNGVGVPDPPLPLVRGKMLCEHRLGQLPRAFHSEAQASSSARHEKDLSLFLAAAFLPLLPGRESKSIDCDFQAYQAPDTRPAFRARLLRSCHRGMPDKGYPES